MRKSLLVLAALALLSVPALAQMPPQVPLDQQVEQAQMRLYAAQSDFYNAAARKLQADLADANKKLAEANAWWGDCVTKPTCLGWVTPAGPAK